MVSHHSSFQVSPLSDFLSRRTERKKILRIIKRIQRQLKELEGADGGKGKEKDNAQSTREELEKELEDARVMLNYVIHYP